MAQVRPSGGKLTTRSCPILSAESTAHFMAAVIASASYVKVLAWVE